MISRRLDTRQEPIVCAVCGRSLLRGEHAGTFIDGTVERQVCELCTTRAAHYGWVRAGSETLRAPRPARAERARSIVGRRRRGRAEEPEGAPSAPAAPGSPMPERRIHAVPTSAAQRASRAVELFNRTEHPRTVAGVARSLGAPAVAVHPRQQGADVEIVVAWELCWYRYAVDLEEDAHGVRLVGQGDELAELGDALAEPNAVADERGELALADAGD